MTFLLLLLLLLLLHLPILLCFLLLRLCNCSEAVAHEQPHLEAVDALGNVNAAEISEDLKLAQRVVPQEGEHGENGRRGHKELQLVAARDLCNLNVFWQCAGNKLCHVLELLALRGHRRLRHCS